MTPRNINWNKDDSNKKNLLGPSDKKTNEKSTRQSKQNSNQIWSPNLDMKDILSPCLDLISPWGSTKSDI